MAKRKRIPDAKDIQRLPRYARIAFAARCARRILPMFRLGWPEAGRAVCRDVENAVRVAEEIAARAGSPDREAAAKAKAAAKAADKVFLANLKKGIAQGISVADENAKLEHAMSAAEAAAAAAGGKPVDAAVGALSVLMGIFSLSSQEDDREYDDEGNDIVPNFLVAACEVVNRDFTVLREKAKAEGWTDSTPVSPTVFGPLWPEGPPPGWPPD